MILTYGRINFQEIMELDFINNGPEKYDYTNALSISLNKFTDVILYTLMGEVKELLTVEFKSYNYKISKEFYKNIIVNKH